MSDGLSPRAQPVHQRDSNNDKLSSEQGLEAPEEYFVELADYKREHGSASAADV